MPTSTPVSTIPTSQALSTNVVDTLERYIALLAVGAKITAPNQVVITFFPQNVEGSNWIPLVKFEGKIPFNLVPSLQGAGDYLDNLTTGIKTNPFPLTLVTPPTATANNPLALPALPTRINTLEKAFAWAVQCYQAGLTLISGANPNWADYRAVEDSRAPYLDFSASIPYDVAQYAKTGNILAAVKQVITALPAGVGV
ncbi:MAG: hypothetical protein NVS2B14_00360 [Chamaesiphon sp.]